MAQVFGVYPYQLDITYVYIWNGSGMTKLSRDELTWDPDKALTGLNYLETYSVGLNCFWGSNKHLAGMDYFEIMNL